MRSGTWDDDGAAADRALVQLAVGLRRLIEAVPLHLHVDRPGSGVRLWESPDELTDRFHLEVVPSPSGVIHHVFWRK